MSTAAADRNNRLHRKLDRTDSVTLDSRGIAYISGTGMKVRQIVMEAQRLCSSAEEIQEAHAHDNLTLEQVEAAFAYYESNKISIDAEIEAEDKYIAEARKSGYRPDVDALRAKLKQLQSA